MVVRNAIKIHIINTQYITHSEGVISSYIIKPMLLCCFADYTLNPICV